MTIRKVFGPILALVLGLAAQAQSNLKTFYSLNAMLAADPRNIQPVPDSGGIYRVTVLQTQAAYVGFWTATNTLSGTNTTTLLAGVNGFSWQFTSSVASDSAKLTKTGDLISGVFAVTNNLTFDGDTNAPNTNWVWDIDFQNLDVLENNQTKTVSWYGKQNLLLQGGIVTITANTNISFVTPNTRAVFFVPTNQWVLSLVGLPDANGNVPADFVPLDNLSLTNTTVANKLASYDSNRKLTSAPAFTGDATSSAGSSALTIPAGTVTDTKAALEVKPACAVVATSNLTLSGEQTIDGVTTSGSLVLATGQSTGSQNGPWLTAAGAWSRPTWFASGSTSQAPKFCSTFIRLGTTYQGSTWRMTTAAAVTIDTTSQTWAQTPYALNASSVTGTVPGANIPPIKADSIAALSAITGSTSVPRVDLLGYYAPGDGGGGLLYWTNTVTGTNTLTRYAALGGGSWQRLVSKPLNPRWAGAKGDFTTDDTTALQACFNWVDPNVTYTNQSMLQIRLDDGWYSVNSITNSTRAEFYGLIRAKSVFSTSAPGLYQRVGATGPLLYSSARIIVHDLQFFGRASANLRNTNTVYSVTDRFNFAVSSTNSVPTSALAAFPYAGPCLFYKTVGSENILVGSGVVLSVTGGTNITLAPNYDWYATDTSSNLSTGWTVCFTPWNTWTNAYGQSPLGPGTTNFYAPAIGEIGNAGVTLYAVQNSIIEHCNISGFTTSLHLKGCADVRVQDDDFYSYHLAGVWGDNLFDSVLDRIQPAGQLLFNGTFINEYASLSGGVLNQVSPAVSSVPTTDSYYCQGRSAVGGWGWNNNSGTHWYLNYGAVGLNLSGQAGYNMIILGDVTTDNSVREAVLLDGSGYVQWNTLTHSSVGGVALASSGFPAIRTLNASFFDGLRLEVNKPGGTNTYTYVADVSGSTPPTNSSLAGFHLYGSPLASSSVIYNGTVYTFPSPGTLPTGMLLAADATTSLQPVTLQQFGVVGTLGTNALPKSGGTMTGILKMQAGTAAAPSIVGSADTTTGLWWPGGGQLGFASTGVNFMRYSGSSLVVGAGATDDASGYGVQIVSPTSSTFGLEILGYGADNILKMFRAGGSLASPSATTSGNENKILFYGTTNGTTQSIGARIDAAATRTWDSTGYGMSLSFRTTANAAVASAVEALFLDQDQTVRVKASNLTIDAAGMGLIVKSGSNCKLGNTGALTAGSVTVSNSKITANSRVFFTLKTLGGTPAVSPYVSAISAGVSFTVTAAATDTSDYYYFIVEAQ